MLSPHHYDQIAAFAFALAGKRAGGIILFCTSIGAAHQRQGPERGL
jgi:hypothetical protein